VIGTSPAEGKKVAARLEDTKTLLPNLYVISNASCIPWLAHKMKFIGRITNNGVNAIFLNFRK
jgi:hypothetical protein